MRGAGRGQDSPAGGCSSRALHGPPTPYAVHCTWLPCARPAPAAPPASGPPGAPLWQATLAALCQPLCPGARCAAGELWWPHGVGAAETLGHPAPEHLCDPQGADVPCEQEPACWLRQESLSPSVLDERIQSRHKNIGTESRVFVSFHNYSFYFTVIYLFIFLLVYICSKEGLPSW